MIRDICYKLLATLGAFFAALAILAMMPVLMFKAFRKKPIKITFPK